MVVEYPWPTAPARSDVVVIFSADEGDGVVAPIWMLRDCCAQLLAASDTFIMKDEEPDTDGFPEIAPEDADSASPTGSAPDVMLQVYGDVPPLAVFEV